MTADPAPLDGRPQAAAVAADLAALAAPDVQTPFADLRDAVARLLPYHVSVVGGLGGGMGGKAGRRAAPRPPSRLQLLAQEEPEAADADEAAQTSSRLLLSRRDAYAEVAAARAAAAVTAADAAAAAAAAAVSRADAAAAAVPPGEVALLSAQLAAGEAARQLEEARERERA